MLRDTQLDSWHRTQATLGKRQQDVFDVIWQRQGATSREIADVLHLPLHSVSGRITELCNQGKVRDSRRRAWSPISKRSLIVWMPV